MWKILPCLDKGERFAHAPLLDRAVVLEFVLLDQGIPVCDLPVPQSPESFGIPIGHGSLLSPV
jgi:hypothetical protein